MDKYRTILIDPPWNERGGGRIKRGADRHYPLLKEKEIIETIRPLMDKVDATAHLYLWTTNSFLPAALEILRPFSFRYITLITWGKDRYGLGQYFRGQTEHMIFAVRGDFLPTATSSESTLIMAKRGRHSAKPEESYTLIEKSSPGPYLELFARTNRPGWTSWGNEPNLFTEETT